MITVNTVTFTVILVVCRDFRLCVTDVKISVLCVISAFEWSLSLMYTRKSCCGRETARFIHSFIHSYSFTRQSWQTAVLRCRCKIRYVSKFTATSRVFSCDSTAFLTCILTNRPIAKHVGKWGKNWGKPAQPRSKEKVQGISHISARGLRSPHFKI